MKATEVRLTLAALIYAIETDLKNAVVQDIIPYFDNLSFLPDEESRKKVSERFKKDNPDLDPERNLIEAIEYLDFQDIFALILKNSECIPPNMSSYLKSIYSHLSKLTPIRNRVMHTRPLLQEDLPDVYSFVNKLTGNESINWTNVLQTKYEIERNSSWVQTLTLPFTDVDEVIHNLPYPDFDDTGFIGRKSDIQDLKRPQLDI